LQFPPPFLANSIPCKFSTPCPAANAEVAICQLEACVADVDAWMKTNWLHLNPQKTQLIWLGSQQ